MGCSVTVGSCHDKLIDRLCVQMNIGRAKNTGINNHNLNVSWKYGLLFFLNIKLFSCLYMYVVLSVLMNVIIILISLLCIHETHVKCVMTVFVIKPVVSLGVTFYIGIGDV